MINKDLSNSYVRVEVICDREGFWLKPHCDIKEKLMLNERRCIQVNYVTFTTDWKVE